MKKRHESNEYCTFHDLPDGGEVGINKGDLYVIPCGDGFSTYGFDNALRNIKAVSEWMGVTPPDVERGSLAAYIAHREVMQAGAMYAAKTGQRCNAHLTPALVGLEGQRVEVTGPEGYKSRFYVGKSTGWLPIHLEIKTRASTGGGSVYIPEGGSVRVVGYPR